MRIRLCGVRGSTPAPGAAFVGVGGNTSCVAIVPTDQTVPTLILDAGTGIRSVSDLVAPLPFRGTILLTHLHWDHVHGLPFFSAADRHGSDVQLLMPADEDGDRDAASILRRAMSPPHFPIGPEGLAGNWRFDVIDEGAHMIEGFTVTAGEVPHKGGRTFGYRIADSDGSVAYLPDHLPANDGAERDAALALATEVDVLIHDSQFVNAERGLAGAYGHSTVEEAIQFAVDARVGMLVLFHHSPARTDAQLCELYSEVADGRISIHLGREGDELIPRTGQRPAG